MNAVAITKGKGIGDSLTGSEAKLNIAFYCAALAFFWRKQHEAQCIPVFISTKGRVVAIVYTTLHANEFIFIFGRALVKAIICNGIDKLTTFTNKRKADGNSIIKQT